jgi:hypothetical protein
VKFPSTVGDGAVGEFNRTTTPGALGTVPGDGDDQFDATDQFGSAGFPAQVYVVWAEASWARQATTATEPQSANRRGRRDM